MYVLFDFVFDCLYMLFEIVVFGLGVVLESMLFVFVLIDYGWFVLVFGKDYVLEVVGYYIVFLF